MLKPLPTKYDYAKSKDNEISIFKDQLVDDVLMISDEWWYGSTDNEKGLCKLSSRIPKFTNANRP